MTIDKVLFALLIISSIDFPCRKTLVSSANNFIQASGAVFSIIFTQRRNNKGPRTDPWGTLHVISSKQDKVLVIVTYCFQFVKQSQNQLYMLNQWKNRTKQSIFLVTAVHHGTFRRLQFNCLCFTTETGVDYFKFGQSSLQ